MIVPIALLLLVTAACNDSDPSGEPTTLAPITTLAQVEAAPATTSPIPSTTVPAPTSTVAPTTSTEPPPVGDPAFAITRVGFSLRPQVVVSNVGEGPGDLTGHRVCAGDGCFEISGVKLSPTESVIVSLGPETPDPGVGVVAVVDGFEAIGPIQAAAGEMALVVVEASDERGRIIDYLEWGFPGHALSGEAAEAGVWREGWFVESSRLSLGIEAAVPLAHEPAGWFSEIGG